MHPSSFHTSRLGLTPLGIGDASFIQELVNTEGWLRHIGNRNIHSQAEAEAYIQRILEHPDIQYWVARPMPEECPAGIITFIKRDYLDHPDIGFAFLPAFSGHGYALEAASGVLDFLTSHHGLNQILATTLPENTRSIRLLEKLGLCFEKAIEVNGETLWVYEKRMDASLIE